MKKVIKTIIILIISMTVITGCGCNKKEKTKESEEIKSNSNEGVVKDQNLGVFKFTNTSLVYVNGTSNLETSVTNTSNETMYLAEFKIHVKEKDKEIVTITGFIGDSLKAGETKIINSYYGEDLTKATSIEYEIVK